MARLFGAALVILMIHAGTAIAVVPASGDDDALVSFETSDLGALQAQFETIADKASPSVVAVSAAQSPPPGTDVAVRPDALNPAKLQDILDQTTRVSGSGFVIDSGGYILTNEHVVGQADQLWVTTADHKVWPAIVVGSDPRADLAVIKTPAPNLVPVKFAGDRPDCRRGQWTIALGNPYGMAIDGQCCMSVGVVSAVDRSLERLSTQEDRLYTRLIQTTAQINPGNSGGPLLDLNGDVIGINTAVILPQKQTNGIGFAIPATRRLLAEARDLEQGREVVYGYLGVTVTDPTDSDRGKVGAAGNVGLCVAATEQNSPAASILRPGDYLLDFNGQTLHDADQFVRLVGDARVGKPAPIDLLRAGRKLTVAAIPARRRMETAAVTYATQRFHWHGMVLANFSADGSGRAGLLVVHVEDDSTAARSGIRPGAFITTVAGKPVKNLTELLAIVSQTPIDRCNLALASPLPATTQPSN